MWDPFPLCDYLDVDECNGNQSCHEDAKCTNTIGSHVCECQPGYTGDGQNCAGECDWKKRWLCSVLLWSTQEAARARKKWRKKTLDVVEKHLRLCLRPFGSSDATWRFTHFEISLSISEKMLKRSSRNGQTK